MRSVANRVFSRVAIVAAMAGELKPLVRCWRHERRNGVDLWRRRFDNHESDQGECVAACAGAGVAAATRAFAEIEKDGAITAVISAGWAGALSDHFEPGTAYWVSGVVDARTGERFETESVGARLPRSQDRDQNRDMGHLGFVQAHPSAKNKNVARVGHPVLFDSGLVRPGIWLVTSPKVADAAEKQRLALAYGAGLVDMEACGVARLAAMRGIPFACIKGVSDGATDQLPDFNRFISANGQFQLARFILFVLPRPWNWPALARMGENSKVAAQGIRESLLGVLDEQDGEGAIRKRNGDTNV
jgi:adenosylhomocysteine nucleosidase